MSCQNSIEMMLQRSAKTLLQNGVVNKNLYKFRLKKKSWKWKTKKSTKFGSPGGNLESDSPPMTSGGGDRVASQVMNMSFERSVEVINAPEFTVGGNIDDSGVVGDVGGGESGELMMGKKKKKKKERPRKYDSDWNLRVPYVGSPSGGVPPPLSVGFTLSPTPTSKYSSGSKKGRGRPPGFG
ncbi:AT-hook motif nuclear-localized protein 7-like [Forsythia ovata]|uniref:AT-hook motif nuclear-localized protein 7-like n=1 Tax=Forsythia ovata TaxID=205694 RepID=A0ABD1SQ33_9LAMI